MVSSFICSECKSKTEFAEDELLEDVTTTSTFVCPSCQTLYDLDKENVNVISKSKFDKTNYHSKTRGITNQLAYTRKNAFTVPCPHCKHIWEMKGMPVKSVHWCPKCYKYFGFDDVKITFLLQGKEKHYKYDFQVSPIYPTSIFEYGIDKLAERWSNNDTPQQQQSPQHEEEAEASESTV